MKQTVFGTFTNVRHGGLNTFLHTFIKTSRLNALLATVVVGMTEQTGAVILYRVHLVMAQARSMKDERNNAKAKGYNRKKENPKIDNLL